MTQAPVRAAPLVDQREKFFTDPRIAYFNTAAVSPMLRNVHAAGIEALQRRAEPWTLTPAAWFTGVERLRPAVATLMGVSATDVALIPATSYGLAVAARNLSARSGQRVLVLDDEFPSNYYTWRRFAARTDAELVVVKRALGQEWADAVIAEVDERLAVASVPNVHWTNGAVIDLERVARAVHQVGAALVIDASQSLGAMPLDIAGLRPEAVVAVGYKWLLGPYSVGYLYLHPRHHGGEPLEENWIARRGSDDFSALVDYQDEYRPGAERFDMGERSNFQLIPMALAAVDQILEWTVPAVAATLQPWTDEIATRAGHLGLTAPPAHARAPHMLGLQLPRAAAHRVADALSAAGVTASVRGSSVRIAPHLHNNHDDVDRLLEAIGSAV